MRSILQRVAFALALTAALIVNVRPAQACEPGAAASTLSTLRLGVA